MSKQVGMRGSTVRVIPANNGFIVEVVTETMVKNQEEIRPQGESRHWIATKDNLLEVLAEVTEIIASHLGGVLGTD